MNKKLNLEEKLQICYKKLKSSVYFDKTQAINRDDLVQYESENNIDEVLKELSEKIMFADDNDWKNYSEQFIKKIYAYSFPKQIKRKEKSDEIICNIENDDMIIEIDINEIQNIARLPIEVQVIGVLWIMEIGIYIDKSLSEFSYGNRLIEDISWDSKSDNWSPYMYKPYFNAYESWRDKALNVAENYYNEKKDCIILTLDIKRFYYSIHMTKDMFSEFLNIDNRINKNDKTIIRINNFVYEVINEYSNILGKDNKCLPIGFMPSPILANWYLADFDTNILNRSNPSYYGRYVDDIIIVDKVEKKSELYKLMHESKKRKERIIYNYFVHKKINLLNKCKKKNYKYKFKRANNICTKINIKDIIRDEYFIRFTNELYDDKLGNLYIQKEKFKIIYLKAGGTKAVIDKFREEIRKNSSEFRLLPEISDIFLDNYNDIYKLQQGDTINKLRGINAIEINKYELSKFIGKQLTIAKFVVDDNETKFYEDIKKIFNNEILLENYSTWESILTLCVINKRSDKFVEIVNKICKAIRLIEDHSNTNVKESLSKFLEACICRSLSLIWGNGIDKYLQFESEDIFENKKEKIILSRERYIKTRMTMKVYSSILVDMFIENDNLLLKEVSKDLYLNELMNNLEFVSQKSKKNIKSIKERLNINMMYKYYPYLITMQDIINCLLFNKICHGEVLNEFNDKEDSTSALTEKIYYIINYRKENLEKINTYIKSIRYNKENNNNNNYNIIKIDNKNMDKVKVAIATARLYDKNLERRLMDESNLSLARCSELIKIVNEAIENKADILVLPENYVPFEWIPLLQRIVKKNSIAIITGIEHIKINNNVYNLTAALFPYEYKNYKFVYSNFRTKVYYSPEEKRYINGYRMNIRPGNEFNLFVWNNIWIPIYCCFEIASIEDRSAFMSLIDIFTVVEWNKDTNYFSNIVEALSRDLHCYCVQVNTANYGDSCIIQPSKTATMSILRTKGGINNSILVENVNIKSLREFQMKEYELQKDYKVFKTTPPNIKNDYVFSKIKGELFNELSEKQNQDKNKRV